MHRSSFAIAAFAAAACAHAQPATFMSFGQNTQAMGVSADGSVVVGSLPGTASVRPVFRWTASGGVQQLGSGIGSSSFVSADGNTVAWPTETSVMRWTPGTGAQVAVAGGISALSGDGTTVVAGSRKWSVSQGVMQLQLYSGASGGLVTTNALSFDGSLAFGAYDRNTIPAQLLPTVWNAAGQPTSLGVPFGQLSDATAAVSSDSGSVVYGIGNFPNLRMFRWTAQTGLVPQPATSNFLPRDTTADGRIVVGTAGFVAAVWTSQHGVQDLSTLLMDEYGLDVGNYSLGFVNGISDDGRTLVGFGNDQITGNRVGWMVKLPYEVPAPGTAILLVIAGGLPRRRR